MPTERLAPDAVLAQANLSGTVADIQEPADSPDAGWLVAVDNAANTDVRVSFPTPSGALTGTQTVRVLVRKSATGGSTPTAVVEMWQAGALVSTVVPTTSVTDPVGVVLTGTFPASAVANPANVEIRVNGVAPGGKPADRRSIGVGAIEWTANVTAPAPNSGTATGSYTYTGTAAGATTTGGSAATTYTLTAAATGQAPTEPAAPPIITADFETGTDQWTAWYGCTVAHSTTQAHTGTGSLAVTAGGASIGLEVNNWPGYGSVVAGTTYDIGASWLGPAGCTLTLSLQWRNGSTGISTTTLPVTSTGTWARETVTATAPAGADTLYVTATSGTATSGQTYHLDSFTVTETTTSGGDPVPTGSAAGGYTFTGTASGASIHAGTAAGASAWTGAASGTTTRQGTTTATTTWTGTATGTTPTLGQATGTSSGSFTFGGTATGATIHTGTTTGGYVYASTATGTTPAVDAKTGTAAGTYGWAASATGSTPTKGTTTGNYQYVGTAFGRSQAARNINITTSPVTTDWATMPTTANPTTAGPTVCCVMAGAPIETTWTTGPTYLEEP